MNDRLCNNRLPPEEVLCSRRQFLTRCGMGLGVLGLASLLSEEVLAAAGAAGIVKPTHFPAHAVATVMMHTGSLRMAKPSMGAWVLYGLGSENENMPGYVSLRPSGGSPPGGALNWGSSFLPGDLQATSINTSAATPEGMLQNIKNEYFNQQEQR